MGGRPSKPVSVNKKHLTSAEIEQRTRYEKSLLSGKKITERKRVKLDPLAHAEFRRVTALMRAIGKDDALYSEQINRYSELFSEAEFYKDLSAALRGELYALSALSREAEAAARQLCDISEEFDEYSARELTENVNSLLETLGELLKERGNLMRQLDNADTKIKQKREAMLSIERENCMTVSAALRTIPKEVEKPEDDELLKVLRGD